MEKEVVDKGPKGPAGLPDEEYEFDFYPISVEELRARYSFWDDLYGENLEDEEQEEDLDDEEEDE